jgi:hypothetical protein
MLLCTISGHCFERWLCPDDEWDVDDTVRPIQNVLLSFYLFTYVRGMGNIMHSLHYAIHYYFTSSANLLANATDILSGFVLVKKI